MKIINDDCLKALDGIESNSVDAIVTDPPYELNFMGNGWDNAGVSFNKETWEKCLRVLKPGGYLLAFGGTRTYHRIACAIEDAGFEIRDCIMWLYGSGFPKSMNIGLAVDKKLGVDNRTGKVVIGAGNNNTVSMNSGVKKNSELKHEYEERKAQNEWKGWGTCLKPSYEPIIVARKPFKGSLVDNVLKNGVGGLNIDECRIDFVDDEDYKITANKNQHEKFGTQPMTNNIVYGDYSMVQPKNYSATGRFPANTILTYGEDDYDEVCGGFPQTKGTKTNSKLLDIRGNNYNNSHKTLDISYERGYNDNGSAARYFYCAKASKKDRDEGLDEFSVKQTGELQGGRKEGSAGSIMQNSDGTARVNPYAGTGAPKRNIHPTVKPTSLMQYLVRLVAPKGATILDPFMGSGSTGKAVAYENAERGADYNFIGIEREAEYCEIARARIEHVK